MLERFVQQLAEDLELPQEAVDRGDGTDLLLTIHSQLKVTLRSLDPGIFLTSPIALYPKSQREDILALICQANFLGQGTGGAVISLDEEGKFLTLSLPLSYDMNYQTFKEHLSDFANYVDYWRDEVNNLQKK